MLSKIGSFFRRFHSPQPHRRGRRTNAGAHSRVSLFEQLETRDLMAALPVSLTRGPVVNRDSRQILCAPLDTADPKRIVSMKTGSTTVEFDTRCGGAVLGFLNNNTPIVDPFGGAGMNVVPETGNDPTQASANGYLANPIARFDDRSTDQFAYYWRERRFDPPAVAGAPAVYEVAGFAPYFWASLDPTDDSIAPSPVSSFGVFQNGLWLLDHRGDGGTPETVISLGDANYQPVVGDFDGDGDDDLALFRDGHWHVDFEGQGRQRLPPEIAFFGEAGDLAVAGDWNGDGRDTQGVFRNGTWYLDLTGNGFSVDDSVFGFGRAGDKPVAGDWNGDGKDEVGVFQDGRFILDVGAPGFQDEVPICRLACFGLPGDFPLAGDWDGDGRDTPAVFRNGLLYRDDVGDGYNGELPIVLSATQGVPVAGNWGNGWRTIYHYYRNEYNGQFTPLYRSQDYTSPPPKYDDFFAPSTPIWFEGTAARKSGMLFVGNEMERTTGYSAPWNGTGLTEIPEGRVAAKVRISLQSAAADGVGGLAFRRQVTNSPHANLDDAYQSPGYFLNVNKAGLVELTRSDGGGGLPVSIWRSVVPAAQTGVNSAAGVMLEVRTHNEIPGYLEIWVEGQRVHFLTDLPQGRPLAGSHFGLFAHTSSGRVQFSDRQVFDVSLEMIVKYTAFANGVIESDIQLASVPQVTQSHPFYRGVLTPFLNSSLYPSCPPRTPTGELPPCETRWRWTYDAGGNRREVGTYPGYEGELVPILQSGGAKSLWAGNRDGNLGLYVTPVVASIDGQISPAPHALLTNRGSNDSFVLAINAFPLSANDNPVLARSFRIVSRWSTHVPTLEGRLINDANANGVFDTGEAPLANIPVYWDRNQNGQFDAGEVRVTTDANGSYRFSGLSAGTLTLRPVLPATWWSTNAVANAFIVSDFNENSSVQNQNLLVTQRPSETVLAGFVFDDYNGNGIREATDIGLPNVVVYIDSNRNGVRNLGEPFKLTDSQGNYRFVNIVPGPTQVRHHAQIPFVGTAPQGSVYAVQLAPRQSITGLHFADHVPLLLVPEVIQVVETNGTKSLQVTLRLSQPSKTVVQVSYSTANGTARSGTDYKATTGVVSWKAGDTVKTISIPIFGDVVRESAEYFMLNFHSPVLLRLSRSSTRISITDND